jgi:hypothetical protein
MTVTAGTVEKPGFSGLLVKKFFDFLAGQNNQRGKTMGLPDYQNITTTTASETGQAIDLTDEGASFLADHLYKITFRSIATTDNDRWIQTWEQYLLGGTTPVLLGSARLINAMGVIAGTSVQYGHCHAQATYAVDTATAVAASSTAGSSLGNASSGTVTLTHPIARATPKWIKGINSSADVVTITESRHTGGFEASSTTFSLFMATFDATPEADGFDDVGVIDVDFFIVPPPSIALSMNSNNVEVIIGHNASDEVRHLVQVWVEEDPSYAPFHGS